MSNVTSIVGAQWGDEGKGRVVDYLAVNSDLVIRYQGGDNAGHTVINEFGKFALHIIPSGIFNPETMNIVGAGTVVNFETMPRTGFHCTKRRGGEQPVHRRARPLDHALPPCT
jgi:adenylosuccinate synthase